MKLDQIIRELWRELRAVDECIAALERLATGHRRRGRPRKTPLPLRKPGSGRIRRADLEKL